MSQGCGCSQRPCPYPYIYLDGVVLKRGWAGEIKNVSVLVALGVGNDGYRRVLDVAEGHKEDKAGWSGFLSHLKQRGLKGVRLIISDACLALWSPSETTTRRRTGNAAWFIFTAMSSVTCPAPK